jgi:hypothetical protein
MRPSHSRPSGAGQAARALHLPSKRFRTFARNGLATGLIAAERCLMFRVKGMDLIMDDTFRLDLADQDKDYIEGVFDAFREGARRRGRKLIEIRMRQAMFERLEMKSDWFRGVPVTITDTGFDGTIEVILGPLH